MSGTHTTDAAVESSTSAPQTALRGPSRAVDYDHLPDSFKAIRADLAGRSTEFKAVGLRPQGDSEGRTVDSQIAVYNVVDEGGDFIPSGAAAQSIKVDFPAGRIKHFLDHRIPLGPAREISEDDKGLTLSGAVTPHASLDLYLAQIIDGTYGDASVGYTATRAEVVTAAQLEKTYGVDAGPWQSVRVLHEIKVYEGGPVIWGMNLLAGVLGVKNGARRINETGVSGMSEPKEKKGLYQLASVLDHMASIRWLTSSEWAQLTDEEAEIAINFVEEMRATEAKMLSHLQAIETKSTNPHVVASIQRLVKGSGSRVVEPTEDSTDAALEFKSFDDGEFKSLLDSFRASSKALQDLVGGGVQ